MKLAIFLFCIASVLALTPVVMAAGPVEFLDGLVLYHPYDEGDGAIAGDLSENKLDGVIDKPKWVDGKFGKALEFGGAGSATLESRTHRGRNQYVHG